MIKFWNVISESCVTVRKTHFRIIFKLKPFSENFNRFFNIEKLNSNLELTLGHAYNTYLCQCLRMRNIE